MLLEISGLEKHYESAGQRRTVLRSLALEVDTGEFSLVFGASGSGKSTLLHLVAGIDLPDAGRIRIAGNDISAWNDDQRTLFRRRRIGYVFQFFHLLPHLTVAQNVSLPLQLIGSENRDIPVIVSAMLERVGLGTRSDDYPESLSGGEQQRVAIARAVVHAPDLLLADEPTGNLDEDRGREILDLLRELSRDRRMTIVMATHSQQARHFADSVHELRHGRLSGSATDI